MKKNLLLSIFLFFGVYAYCLSPEEEYDFLLKDLYNYSTSGYKGTFDFETDKSDGKINLAQGSVQTTNNNLDIAIVGNGFFKVKDEKGNVYYTRFGELRYDNETCSLYVLVGNSKYFLDLSVLPKYTFVGINQIRIRNDGSVVCLASEETSSGNGGMKNLELKNGLNGEIIIDDERFDELRIGQKKEEKKEIIDKIVLYDIKETNIDFYDGYLIKTKTAPKTVDDPYFICGALELSNVFIDKVLIRMLFVIEKLDDNKIKQKEVKKYLIQKMLDPDFIRVKLFGYFYEEHPNLNDISGLKDYVHFLERNYE